MTTARYIGKLIIHDWSLKEILQYTLDKCPGGSNNSSIHVNPFSIELLDSDLWKIAREIGRNPNRYQRLITKHKKGEKTAFEIKREKKRYLEKKSN